MIAKTDPNKEETLVHRYDHSISLQAPKCQVPKPGGKREENNERVQIDHTYNRNSNKRYQPFARIEFKNKRCESNDKAN